MASETSGEQGPVYSVVDSSLRIAGKSTLFSPVTKSALSQQLLDTNTDQGKWGDSLDGMLGPHRGNSHQGPWEISQPLALQSRVKGGCSLLYRHV